MNNILQKNMKLMEKHQPHVFNKVNAYINGTYSRKNSGISRILLARDGELIINVLVECGQDQFLLCNHENPIIEAYAWIDSYIDPSNKAEIVFGMGLGFHLEVLLTSFKNKKVIIVEPDIELFYQILSIRNLELVIENSEIFVEEDMGAILQRVYALYWDTERGDIQCQPFPVYGDMFGSLWDELRSKFIKQAENFTVDITTRRHFGEKWIYNYIKNAGRLSGASNAGALEGGFKGVPGILVSAGPSLEKNMHLLKDLEDKCVIMAAGTAVTILEKNGITPHFMVGIDADKEEGDIHRGVKSRDIHFIYSNQVSPYSVDGYNGPKFCMNYSVDAYTAEFFRFAGIKSTMYLSGPSVANTCFDILYKMGCDPIIIVGQDLAFNRGRNYAGESPGSLLDEEEDLRSQGYILTKDIYGNDVYTQPPYITMKNWFEGYFEKVGDRVEIINATEGGLNIEHARNSTLSSVISGHDFKTRDILGLIRSIHQTGCFPEDMDKQLEEFKSLALSEIARLHQLRQKQMKLGDLIKRDIYHPGKDRRAFEKMVGRVSEITDRVVESPIYRYMLRNILEIEFFMIKAEVDRIVKALDSYKDIKEVYVEAIERQNELLKNRLDKLEMFLNEKE